MRYVWFGTHRKPASTYKAQVRSVCFHKYDHSIFWHPILAHTWVEKVHPVFLYLPRKAGNLPYLFFIPVFHTCFSYLFFIPVFHTCFSYLFSIPDLHTSSATTFLLPRAGQARLWQNIPSSGQLDMSIPGHVQIEKARRRSDKSVNNKDIYKRHNSTHFELCCPLA